MPTKKSAKVVVKGAIKPLQNPWKLKEDPPKQTSDKFRYDLQWHSRNFDQWQHGYIWKKGYMWYRRPDGVDVRAHAAINEMTEDGELIPKSNFTA